MLIPSNFYSQFLAVGRVAVNAPIQICHVHILGDASCRLSPQIPHGAMADSSAPIFAEICTVGGI